MNLTETAFRNDLVKTGLAQLGHAYRDSAVATNWPPAQFDCSTFVHWIFAKHGVDLDAGKMVQASWPPPEPRPWYKYPGYTIQQQGIAHHFPVSIISYRNIRPGDVLYYDKPGQHHVVMYIGGGKVVHAAGTAYGVIVSPSVPPDSTGFGGKTLSLCVSATGIASAMGYKFIPPGPSRHVKHLLHMQHTHQHLTEHELHVIHVYNTTGVSIS